jgi:hypothetical protein
MQALVLPLAVYRQAVDRETAVVQRLGEGPNIGGQSGELVRPPADMSRRQGRPEACGELGKSSRLHCQQPCQAEPEALEERVRARAWVRRIGEHRGLAHQPVVRLRAEDRKGNEVGEHDSVPNLAPHDIVEAKDGRLEYGRAAHSLLAGSLPDRQWGGHVAGDHSARPPAASRRKGGQRGRRRQLVAEDRPGSTPRAQEGAAQSRGRPAPCRPPWVRGRVPARIER